MREYRTGTRWCFWRWKDIGYIKRLHVFQCPWFSICVHWIIRPDAEEFLHDHPVSFLSLILPGTGYLEEREDGYHHRRLFNFVRASTRHRIVYVLPKTVTLCFMGPRQQEWGFFTPDGKISWKEYQQRDYT